MKEPPAKWFKNNRSARDEPIFGRKSIDDLIDTGTITEVEEPPHKINLLTVLKMGRSSIWSWIAWSQTSGSSVQNTNWTPSSPKEFWLSLWIRPSEWVSLHCHKSGVEIVCTSYKLKVKSHVISYLCPLDKNLSTTSGQIQNGYQNHMVSKWHAENEQELNAKYRFTDSNRKLVQLLIQQFCASYKHIVLTNRCSATLKPTIYINRLEVQHLTVKNVKLEKCQKHTKSHFWHQCSILWGCSWH